jgi:hypothetical protein
MKPQRSRSAKTKGTPDVAPLRDGAPAPPLEIAYEEIARLAYSYWEARGSEEGSADEDWARAEEELRRRAAPPAASRASAAG